MISKFQFSRRQWRIKSRSKARSSFYIQFLVEYRQTVNMNTFTVLLFCIQACLVQNIFGQCLSRFGGLAPAAAIEPLAGIAPFGAAVAPFGAGLGPFGYDLAYPGSAGLAAPYDVIAPYGGVGEGNVAVAGNLPVVGTTAVAGQVPIMGAVRFGGDVAAAGAVSISGSCACGCGAPYLY